MFAKSIICVVGTRDADDDMRKACQLGLEMDAHLTILVIGIAPSPSVGDYPVGSVSVDRWQAELAAVERQAARATEICERAGVRFDVTGLNVEKAWADDEIAERVRYCDLVVIGPGVLADETLKQQTVAGTLFASERPVMVLPAQGQPTLKPGTVLLAWDSSREAARAAYDMRSLLAAAASVSVTMVDPVATWRGNGDEPGADIAAYLVRQGANVTVERLASAGRPVSAVLAQHAGDIKADLVVMGAYHHTRFRQRLLGGVTSSMLDMPALPVLMSR